MPNYLHPIQTKYQKARDLLELALNDLEEDICNPVNLVQSLNVTDEMAEVFKEKPVILIQSMSVQIIQFNNRVNKALRLFNEVDIGVYREAALRAIRDKAAGK